MKRRCPGSKFIGIATLPDWFVEFTRSSLRNHSTTRCRKWIINTRNYANVVPSSGDIVYGALYELTTSDEAKLDVFEGVPDNYVKRIIPVHCTGKVEHVIIEDGKKVLDALVYVDQERTSEGGPTKEYIYRINMGVNDAIEEGVPVDYVERYIRPFIPAE